MEIENLGDGLEAELSRRREREGLRYVKLNKATQRYAEAFCDPSKTIILFPASNSIGKTWSTTALIGWMIWPEYAPKELQPRLIEKAKGIDRSFRICSTPEEAGQLGTLQRAIKTLWPKGRYKYEKNRKAFDSVFECDNGWIGDIMTYEQEAEEFEGATRGLIVYNEPPPEEVRKACVFRTRMGGFEVFPMTPLAGSAWIKDKLVDRAAYDSKIAVVVGDIEDACREHGLNGHLSHKRITELIEEMDPDEIEARAHGKFMHLSGLLFKNFTREKFSAKGLKTESYSTKFQVIDPGGYNKPFAIIWGQVVAHPMNGIQILREWPDGSMGPTNYFENMKSPEMKVEDYCKMFSEVEKSIGFERTDVHRILDKRFGHIRDNTTGQSLRDHFSEKGYDFYDSYSVPEKAPELQTGIQAIRNYLKADPLTNVPYLLIDDMCVNTMRAFERWALDPKTQKPNDDTWKNFADVVRYACAANLSVSLRETWSDFKQPTWNVT